MFRFEDGKARAVLLDQVGPFWTTTAQPRPTLVEHASSRDLVIRDSSVYGYRNQPGSGPLFLENVVGSPWSFQEQQVWARQFNVEGDHQPLVLNQGSRLWVLGLKTELPTTIIETVDGGSTEVVGGLIYPVHPVPADVPAFVSDDGAYSLSYAVSAYSTSRNYTLQVEDTHKGATHRLESSDLLERGYGSVVPLFTGSLWRSPEDTSPSAAVPSTAPTSTPTPRPSATPTATPRP
jgi:hypothetical protein